MGHPLAHAEPRQLKAGDTVYSQHGHQAQFVAHVGGEFIVRPVYEDDEGEQLGNVETWSAIFRTPPAPKLDAETAKAELRLLELTEKVNAMAAAKRELESDEKARLERIMQHDAFAELDRYLAGEITHYVATHDYYPSIEVIPVGQTVEGYPSSNSYGLLSLYPSRKWDKTIWWSVTYRSRDRNTYSETKIVIPCCGEEAATAKAIEVLSFKLAAYLLEEPRLWSYPEQLVTTCARFGVEVPRALTEGIASRNRARLEAQLAESRKKTAEAEAALAAIAAANGGAS